MGQGQRSLIRLTGSRFLRRSGRMAHGRMYKRGPETAQFGHGYTDLRDGEIRGGEREG